MLAVGRPDDRRPHRRREIRQPLDQPSAFRQRQRCRLRRVRHRPLRRRRSAHRSSARDGRRCHTASRQIFGNRPRPGVDSGRQVEPSVRRAAMARHCFGQVTAMLHPRFMPSSASKREGIWGALASIGMMAASCDLRQLPASARRPAARRLDQSLHRSTADDAGRPGADPRTQPLFARCRALLGCGEGQPVSAIVGRGRGRAGAEAGHRRRRPLYQARDAGTAEGKGLAGRRVRCGALAGRCQEADPPDGRSRAASGSRRCGSCRGWMRRSRAREKWRRAGRIACWRCRGAAGFPAATA